MNERFTTFMLSCKEREKVREETLSRLQATDWPDAPHLVLDDEAAPNHLARIHRTWRRALRSAMACSSCLVLLLEDDLLFGRWFAHNVLSWPLLDAIPPGGAFFASLYNPSHPFLKRRPDQRYLVANPDSVWGSQAIVMTPTMACYIDTHWDQGQGNPDQRMPRLAARVAPVHVHVPSLVDHVQVPTTWGGISHRACDFDTDWKATPKG